MSQPDTGHAAQAAHDVSDSAQATTGGAFETLAQATSGDASHTPAQVSSQNASTSQPGSKPEKSSDSKKSRQLQWVALPYEPTTNPFRDQMPTTLTRRDGKFGKAGKKAIINVNSHAVTDWPTSTVYQYDVSNPD